MSDSTPNAHTRLLASEVRNRFMKEVDAALPSFLDAARRALAAIDVKDMRASMDMQAVMQALGKHGEGWMAGMRMAWREALAGSETRMGSPLLLESMPTELALVGDEEVETRILASRLSLAVNDKASQQLNDLRVRVRHLEGSDDLHAKDVLRPDVLTRIVVEQWVAAGMTRESWGLVHETMRAVLAQLMTDAYRHANEFLIERGALREIDLRPLMRRAADVGVAGAAASAAAPGSPPASGPSSGMGVVSSGGGASMLASASRPGGMAGGTGFANGMASAGPGRSGYPGADQEARMSTATSPMGRVRQRAQGVLGQLRRLISDRVADYDADQPIVPSPEIAAALKGGRDAGFPATELLQRSAGSTLDLGLVARYVDERGEKLKQQTSKEAEKAIVEIVALMFQAILAEERIPPVVRVWFARLQIPVLRVAMVEPDFLGSTDHPARQLIDRMGACVMGFDAAGLQGGRLEAEIRRVVQVIEQYPETGKRVFQLVHEEFKKFLARHLTGSEAAKRVVSVAQQVEQKEALSIQYTIELRKLLDTMPVSDMVREFMFKVWADVMAMGAVRHGGQHADTLALKRTATDLVWAASPKPTGPERTAVIQALPKLLARLRQGMDLLGLAPDVQEAHIKSLNDAVAQAFLNRASVVTEDQIEQLARGLASLEDVVTDDAAGDVMLDPTSIELMLGVDASALEVITHGGSDPSHGMVAWAHELEIGQWFQLHHQDQTVQVQYAWRSERGQIHLFTTATGHSYLIQARRLASFLQAGLIYPTEEEALTVRATRMAIAKLEAEPTRLLQVREG